MKISLIPNLYDAYLMHNAELRGRDKGIDMGLKEGMKKGKEEVEKKEINKIR